MKITVYTYMLKNGGIGRCFNLYDDDGEFVSAFNTMEQAIDLANQVIGKISDDVSSWEKSR